MKKEDISANNGPINVKFCMDVEAYVKYNPVLFVVLGNNLLIIIIYAN